MRSIMTRFWSFVDNADDPDACWIWTGHRNASGYGKFSIFGQSIRAHRFSAAYHGNPTPRHLVTDHLCRNRACVNPRHLEAVTHQENVRRGARSQSGDHPPRSRKPRNKVCARGHILTNDTMYFPPSRDRGECLECRQAWQKDYNRKRREQRAAQPKKPIIRKVRLTINELEAAALRDHTQSLCVNPTSPEMTLLCNALTPIRQQLT